MSDIEALEKIGYTAVRRLRKQKLERGQPFLIWSPELPKDQSYLEYPDHTIKIVSVSPDLKSFTVIKEVPLREAQHIRQALDLT